MPKVPTMHWPRRCHLHDHPVLARLRAHHRSRELAIGARDPDEGALSHRLCLLHALRIIPTIEEEIPRRFNAAQAVRGVVRERSVAGRIGETKRYAMPASRRQPAQGLDDGVSMEARAFGAYPQRTFVKRPTCRRVASRFCAGCWSLVFAGGRRSALAMSMTSTCCRAVSRWQARPGMMRRQAASGRGRRGRDLDPLVLVKTRTGPRALRSSR